MRSPYFTTSLHILTFPLLTEYASLLEAIQNASSPHDRRKRALQHYARDNKGKRVPLDTIAKERTPLIKRIFGVDKLEDIPNFSTQPITDIRLMTEIKRWNVTNSDLMRRARYYKPEEPRIKVLRTIGYCEYRQKQIEHFAKVIKSRSLNSGELALLQNLLQGYHPIFDKFLNEEFGDNGSFKSPTSHTYRAYEHVYNFAKGYHDDYFHNDDDNLHPDHSSPNLHPDHSSSNPHLDHPFSNPHLDNPFSNPHLDHPFSNPHLDHPLPNPYLDHPLPNSYPDHYPTNLHLDHSPTNFHPNHFLTHYVETYPTHNYGQTHVIYTHSDYENYNDERHHFIYAQNNHSSYKDNHIDSDRG
ncbi:unnamed protein product [Heligmosomoides polygyrus]|uniref:DUF4817 domain-containing protein n=1 Tax=Heligmosomoides polygyrus TaxID=6339 RepID=A0A183GBP2_HELPZ|nr:unnamed protein product [Heligmosomoides polygyrus]